MTLGPWYWWIQPAAVHIAGADNVGDEHAIEEAALAGSRENDPMGQRIELRAVIPGGCRVLRPEDSRMTSLVLLHGPGWRTLRFPGA